VDAVHHGGGAKLLGAGAALGVGERVAVEAGGDELVWRAGSVSDRSRKKVSSQLLDGEAIVAQVGVESVDDPVAIAPDGAVGVVGVALRVGVTSEVEP